MVKRASLAVVFGFFMVSCSQDTATTNKNKSNAAEVAAVRSAIELANGRFLDAFKKGDKAGLVANYTDDAVVMQPNEPAWAGKVEIDKGFTAFLSQMTFKDGSVKTSNVMLAGDLAVETGAYEWTLQPKSGPAVKDNGKYITVWKRQADNSWKIVRDINNSDVPVVKARKATARKRK